MSFLTNYFYNDAANIPVYFMTFGVALAVLAASIFFHELGHWLFFKMRFKKNIKIHFKFESIGKMYWEAGEKDDYVGLTRKQYNDMLLSGIAMGFIPIIFSAYIWFPFLLMILPYGAGIWSDLKLWMEGVELKD